MFKWRFKPKEEILCFQVPQVGKGLNVLLVHTEGDGYLNLSQHVVLTYKASCDAAKWMHLYLYMYMYYYFKCGYDNYIL